MSLSTNTFENHCFRNLQLLWLCFYIKLTCLHL